MVNAKPINVHRLKELLHYEPETGVFTWLVTRTGTAKRGDVAGRISRWGYRQIQFDGLMYMAHRLAWAYVKGDLPTDIEIDHKNGLRDGNRFANFRVATSAQNKQNYTTLNRRNTSGINGVSFITARGKFRAHIKINKRTVNLGDYTTVESAHGARLAAERKYYPFAQSNLTNS